MSKLNYKNIFNKELKSAGSSGSADAAPRMTEQVGRSMIEMLGVLAVMGVLSVAGIVGYNNAMNRHRANELLYEASKRATVVAAQAMTGKTGEISLSEFGNNTVSGVTFSKAEIKENHIVLTLSGVESSICTKMNAALGDNTVMAVNNDCTVIAFNADMSKGVAKPTSCNPACTGGKECVNSTCQCPDDKPIWSGTVCEEKATCTENQWYNAVANTCDVKKNCSGDNYVPELNICTSDFDCTDFGELDSINHLCHVNCTENETPYLWRGYVPECCPNTKELKRVFVDDPNYHCVDPCPSGEYYCTTPSEMQGSFGDGGYLTSDGTCVDDIFCCPGKIISISTLNGEFRGCCEEGATGFDVDEYKCLYK